MSDIADIANDTRDMAEAIAIAAAQTRAAQIPAGEPGDCDFCGEWSGRLVAGACAPCRDARRLP